MAEVDDSRFPSAREMVEAFIAAPSLIHVGARSTEGTRVVVLSSVELWRWRTVLRGVVANTDFALEPARSAETKSSCDDGVSTGVIAPSVGGRLDVADVDWMLAFSLRDDVGTTYRLSGWSGGGTWRHQLWTDVEWRFDAPVPANATHIVVAGPVVGTVELSLHSAAE